MDKNKIEIKTRKVGDRVLIIGKHVWSGHTGTIGGDIKTIVGSMWKVELDNGFSAGCRDKDIIKV